MLHRIMGILRRFWLALAVCAILGLALALPVKPVYAAVPEAEALADEPQAEAAYISDTETQTQPRARAPNPAPLPAMEAEEDQTDDEPGEPATAGSDTGAEEPQAADAAETQPESLPAEPSGEPSWVYAPQAGTEANLWMMVCCVDGQGRRMYHQIFTIPTPEGPLTARNNQTGTACLGPLAPGMYTLESGLGDVTFTLLENGAVVCDDPLCCADGEYLALSAAAWASLELTLAEDIGEPLRIQVTDGEGTVHLCLLAPDTETGTIPAWTLTCLPSGAAEVEWTGLDTGRTGGVAVDLAPGGRQTVLVGKEEA